MPPRFESQPNPVETGGSGFFGEFFNGAAYSAFAEPMLGVSQIVDRVGGTKCSSNIQRTFGGLHISAPEKAEFGSLPWCGQQLGNAVGMMVPLLVTKRCLKSGMGKVFGEELAHTGMVDLRVQSERAFAAMATKEIGLSAANGFLYESLLRPSQPGETDFIASRLRSGLSGAITFGSLTASGIRLGKIGQCAAVEGKTFSSVFKDNVTNREALRISFAAATKNPITNGFISALPSGLLSSEVAALGSGRALPSWQEAKESVTSLAFVGTTLGATHHLGAQRENTPRTNFDYVCDKAIAAVTGKKAPSDTPETRTFKHVGNEQNLTRFCEEVGANGNNGAQITIPVRESLGRGLFGGGLSSAGNVFERLGIWGDKYGETRNLLLKHEGDLLTRQSAGDAGIIATCQFLEPDLSTRDVFANRTQEKGPVWLSRESPDRLTLSFEPPRNSNGFAEPTRLGDLAPPPGIKVDTAPLVTPEYLNEKLGKSRADKLWPLVKDLEPVTQQLICNHRPISYAPTEQIEALSARDLEACSKVFAHDKSVKLEDARLLIPLIQELDGDGQKAICEYSNWKNKADIVRQLEGQDVQTIARVLQHDSMSNIDRAKALVPFISGLEPADQKSVCRHACGKSPAEFTSELTGRNLNACSVVWRKNPMRNASFAEAVGNRIAGLNPEVQEHIISHLSAVCSHLTDSVQGELANPQLETCAGAWKFNPFLKAEAAEKLVPLIADLSPESKQAVCNYVQRNGFEDRIWELSTSGLEAVSQINLYSKTMSRENAVQLWPLIKNLTAEDRLTVCQHVEDGCGYFRPLKLSGTEDLQSCAIAWRVDKTLAPEMAGELGPLLAPLNREAQEVICKRVSDASLSPAQVRDQLTTVDLASCSEVWRLNTGVAAADAVRLAPLIKGMEPAQQTEACKYVSWRGYDDSLRVVWEENDRVKPDVARELAPMLTELTPASRKAICDYVAKNCSKAGKLIDERFERLNLENCGRVWQLNPNVERTIASAVGECIGTLSPEAKQAVCDYAANHPSKVCREYDYFDTEKPFEGMDLESTALTWRLGHEELSPKKAEALGKIISGVRPEARAAVLEGLIKYSEHVGRHFEAQEANEQIAARTSNRNLEACAQVWKYNATVAPSVAERLAPVINECNGSTAVAVCEYVKRNKVKASEVQPLLVGKDLAGCAEAWKYCPGLHPTFAEQFPAATVRERIAASLAWSDATRHAGDAPLRTITEDCSSRFRHYKDMAPKELNETYARNGQDSLLLLLESMRGARPGREAGTLTAPELTAFHEAVLAKLRRAGDETTVRQSYYDAARALNVNAYREVLLSLRGEVANEANTPLNRWQNHSAAALALTFGKDWKSWLVRCEKVGINTHDASYWLPIDPQANENGLRAFLTQNLNGGGADHMSDLRYLAKAWPRLHPSCRQSLADRTVSVAQMVITDKAKIEYGNIRHSGFAAESMAMGVDDKTLYANYEARFLRSQSVPSPFPLEKKWSDGNLEAHFIPRSDPRGIYLGARTNCCQHPDDAGAACAWYGQENKRSGFFVVENKEKEVVAQSWAWLSDDGKLCFDSLESKGLGTREGAILNLYKQAAGDLAKKFKQVSLGFSDYSPRIDLSSLPPAGSKKLGLPADYRRIPGWYSDAGFQVILAEDPQQP